MKQELRDFYVYVLLDTRYPGNFEFGGFEFSRKPFYVGKGRKDRWKAHFGNRKKIQHKHLHNKINSIRNSGFEADAVIISNYFNEQEAYSLEKYLIRNIGLDSLVNKAPGGIGVGAGTLSGDKNPTKRKEVREKISKSLKGNRRGEKRKGIKTSPESKLKMALVRKGKTYEDIFGTEKAAEMRRALSEFNKNRIFSKESKLNMKQAALSSWKTSRKSREDGIMRYRNKNYIEIYESNAMSVNYMNSLGFTGNQISISLGITRVMVKRIIKDSENFMEM